MSRIAYGFLSMLIIIFVFAVAYILINPAFETWIEIGLQINTDLVDTVNFIGITWDLLPLGLVISLIIWGVLAGMGAATNPGRVVFGWLLLLASINCMLAGYVTVDPIVESLVAIGTGIGGVFAPVISFLHMMWIAYPIPVVFAILIWTFAQSLATEPNTEYI